MSGNKKGRADDPALTLHSQVMNTVGYCCGISPGSGTVVDS